MERKKIILYNPYAVFFDMPLALLAIGTALDPEEYEVIIIDARIDKNADELVLLHAPDALCFACTVLTGSPLKDVLRISEKIKQAYPLLPVIWGGWHTSLFPKNPLVDETCVDITVQGQGEETFKELVTHLAQQLPLENVKGICFKKQGEVIQTPPRSLTDMNKFGRINYELIEVEKYFQKKGKRQFDMITSIGCFFRCAFCADPFVYNRKFSAYTAQRMADDIEFFYKKYQFTDLNFQDETFFTYPKQIGELATELINRNIKITWAATMRADQGSRMSDQEWATCKQSGLRRVLIGVESGSQEMMDWLEKDIKIEKVLFCAAQCKKYNIDVIFPFIVGFPGETDESVTHTVAFVKKLKAMSPGFRTEIFYYKPYPGSKITTNMVNEGYELPASTREWANFDYIGSSGPWVSKEKYTFFQHFKFYSKLGWEQKRIYLAPLAAIARWRCNKNQFKFPWEKALIEFLKPQQKLS
jgi:radical SAM superfamily enzyme YgiQ (UPF0313 family)